MVTATNKTDNSKITRNITHFKAIKPSIVTFKERLSVQPNDILINLKILDLVKPGGDQTPHKPASEPSDNPQPSNSHITRTVVSSNSLETQSNRNEKHTNIVETQAHPGTGTENGQRTNRDLTENYQPDLRSTTANETETLQRRYPKRVKQTPVNFDIKSFNSKSYSNHQVKK